MKTITPGTLHSLPPCAATIGFFDGVHRGHRFLLEQVKEEAAGKGLCPSVITFPTHPRQVLQPDFHPQLLSTPEEKLHLLEAAGIANCILLPFTAELSRLSAKEFMLLLRTEYNVRTLVIGYDHRFGHDKVSHEEMMAMAQEIGIKIIKVSEFIQDENVISSTKIRNLLQEGNVEKANDFLGYRYGLKGVVVSGQKVGRTIGFPTANMKLYEPLKLVPADGVYCVYVEVLGKVYIGICNIGTRPTVGESNERTIETHILNFEEDIYGLDIKIEFVGSIRAEKKFPSLDALKEQLQKDKDFAQSLLKDKVVRKLR
jgi:riboflavin kinase/FMN adenylyltransferase